MSDFRTLLIEGLFYYDKGILRTAEETLLDQLVPFSGKDVHLAIHHLPQIPIDPSKWGGGCCMWQPSPCPAGHHDFPDRILNLSLRGRFLCEGETWGIEQLDGKRVLVPFDLLEGHYGRVACATVFDVQAMRESLGDLDVDQVQALAAKATDLREIMSRLQGIMKRGEK